MRIDAVGVSSSDMKKTASFYSLLGFEFPEFTEGEDHVEAAAAGIRLMIDSKKLVTELLGEPPRPGNTSAFALKYDSPREVDAAASKVAAAGHAVVMQPWDAFWGQRYAVVQDPDGYRIDLFAAL